MKIILTEIQICQLIILEDYKYNQNTLLNENINTLKRKIRNLLLSGVAVASLITAINGINATEDYKRNVAMIAKQEAELLQQQMKQDSITNAKINMCEKYMEMALKNQGYNKDSTKLTAEALVRASEKYSFDLPLLMSAAHLESCFGATPRAQRTNSVYSVGSYDNGKNMVSYSHPNQSIEGYINLLRNDYLIDGKTIGDLLKPGGFVNKNGHRYASKKNYESLLKSVRNKIIKLYPDLA